MSHWTIFYVVFFSLLLLDLKLTPTEADQASIRRGVLRVSLWVGFALACALALAHFGHSAAAKQFGACYLKALSVDHVLLFFAVFQHFGVKLGAQRRLLFWGAILNVLLRAKLVFIKLALFASAYWIVYLLGVFLILYGAKILRHYQEPPIKDAAELWSLKLMQRLLPVAVNYQGSKFIVRENLQWKATPLLIILLSLELYDICYALDEIPAMFAISLDPFILVSTSSLAAITLRALYLVLAPFALRLVRVRAAAGVLLVFSGIKLLFKNSLLVPEWLTLLIIISVISSAVIWSLRSEAYKAE